MVSIRGATTIKKDSEEEIIRGTFVLLEKIISLNSLRSDKITAIFFSCTKDITAAYPAKAARDMGLTDIPLLCFQDMYVEGSIEKCIRLCVFYDGKIDKKHIKHVFLNDAKQLRPELVNGI